MGQKEAFILVGYFAAIDKFAVLGFDSEIKKLLRLSQSLKDVTQISMKAVALPKSLTVEQVLTDEQVLRDNFNYLIKSDEDEHEIEEEVVKHKLTLDKSSESDEESFEDDFDDNETF